MSNSNLIDWLKFVAFLHTLAGIALVADFPSFVWEAYRRELYLIFNINIGASPEHQALLTAVVRLFGATVASWGVTMWIIIHSIEEHGIAKYRLSFITALLIWFALDCAVSFSYGIYIHLLVNIAALLSILVPLILLKRQK